MNREVIAERLKSLRGDRTCIKVATAIGVSPQAYSMYEAGQRIPRDETKLRIAEYYHKSVSSIFFTD